MARFLKEYMTEELNRWAPETKNCVMVDFRGLNAGEAEELRRKLRENGIRMNVVPNRLFKRALRESVSEEFAGREDVAGLLQGPTAVVFGGEGALTASKLLVDWRKEHKSLGIKGAVVDWDVLGVEEAEELARIPGKEELLTRVVGGIASPLNSFAFVLSGVLRSLASVLNSIKEKKENE